VSQPRFFVLTAGRTADEAIDYVEGRGHVVIATALTPAASVALYGICEVEAPSGSADSEAD
jgi:hypothetical protein